ncbi:MAG: cyclic-di-AMP receptor [Anaerolineae bacterium]
MKLIIVIARDHDADVVTQALTAEHFRVTRIASTGGFLRSGVATLLVGVDDAQVQPAIDLMRATLNKISEQSQVTLFVVPVERFEQV